MRSVYSTKITGIHNTNVQCTGNATFEMELKKSLLEEPLRFGRLETKLSQLLLKYPGQCQH